MQIVVSISVEDSSQILKYSYFMRILCNSIAVLTLKINNFRINDFYFNQVTF